jgi:hypothetical protein
MLLNVSTLNTFDVDASDGPVGTIVDSRFSDSPWALQDLVVNTRKIVSGREVLVPVGAVRQLDIEQLILRLGLLKEQVDNTSAVPEDRDGAADADTGARSTKEVIGYHIRAGDETFGHLEDMLIEPDTWAIRYLLIDTRNWWPGPPVLVAPDWVNHFDWVDKKLTMDVSAERIQSCPPYDPASPPTREYETVLYRHYQRTEYWR